MGKHIVYVGERGKLLGCEYNPKTNTVKFRRTPYGVILLSFLSLIDKRYWKGTRSDTEYFMNILRARQDTFGQGSFLLWKALWAGVLYSSWCSLSSGYNFIGRWTGYDSTQNFIILLGSLVILIYSQKAHNSRIRAEQEDSVNRAKHHGLQNAIRNIQKG